jgi:hypothetical protein
LGSKNDSTGGTSAYQAPAANTNAGVVSASVETTEQVDDLPF